ncbi:MAG: NPCBM/NEW2 domain-containing protein, partial [Phycisphaerae bacterium]
YSDSTMWVQRTASRADDYVMLTNGDVVRGFITSIDADYVVVESSLGETRIPHRVALSVGMASRPAAQLDKPYFIVMLRSSGRVTATDFEWSGDRVDAVLRYGQHVRIEAERIVRVDVEGGRWEWLGEHDPISSEQTSMLSLHWPRRIDQNVFGGQIVVGREAFEHGIGVHSRSSLTYDLRGAYREFVTSFGIDDTGEVLSDVSVFILVDGQRRFTQRGVRRGRLFGPVRLDVTNAKRIELIVDFGENGDLQDRFDWVEAALIR